MGLSLLVRCEWARAERFVGVLQEIGLEVRACCSTKAAAQQQHDGAIRRSGVTHGGFVWVRTAAVATEEDRGVDHCLETTVAALRLRSSFDRLFTALFPTRRVLPVEAVGANSGVKAIASSLAKLVIDSFADTPVPGNEQTRQVRLHVFDADTEQSDSQLYFSLGEALCAANNQPPIVLSPVSFSAVVVAVRCDGVVEWDVLTPEQYGAIKQHSQHGEVKPQGEDALQLEEQSTMLGQGGVGRKVCRAAHKLLDALQLLQRRHCSIDTRLSALDVGSSPGGWTEALLEYGCAKVVAIDPAGAT